jgi:hypothetical protein
VDDQEFYQLLDQDGITDDSHLFNEKLREWEDSYNYHRPHGALGGQTPYERLVKKTRAGLSAQSWDSTWKDSGRYHTNAGGMRRDADHSLVRTVGSGAVCERNDSKPEQPSENNADQPCEAHRSQRCRHSDPRGLHAW